ncbi:dihydropteroate synthase [Lachnospiraceae bacterium PF1-21]|uniref:Dihydropteroate synthase n=1 Tax=Ohessyouella blattaphilus TaxID=2949333 RepID=A0ABT1EGI5_9FIRM|nr:dihydropteroate synthase [Ohessyouella blattaphilus]MCP1109807.1 dihydropteroate synthase [Ohessyouella blattaphilus]MCR8563201.1 dihydropteroate synthase [Ohessyouella blattaphilus]
MVIGKREFDLENKQYIMGILNVTPDSFSDGGRFQALDEALFHVEQMTEEGADIIDIGGESTRPNYEPVSDEEEIGRIVPVIEKIKARFDVPLSLDTYKSQVAQAGIDAGADMINDIWGLKADPKMAQVVAKGQVAVCLMHNRQAAPYQDFISQVQIELQQSLDLAKSAGIADERIILDPGVGFAKSLEENLKIINHLDALKTLGYPVLLGTSRKSVIGQTLGVDIQEREEGTLVTTVIGMMKGASVFRVHNVKGNKRALAMARAIIEA